MRNIFQSETITDAGLVCSLLARNGIDAKVVEQSSHYPPTINSEVWITNDEQAEQAIEIIRGYTRSQSSDSGSWECSSCTEKNPGSFEVCWQCGAAAK